METETGLAALCEHCGYNLTGLTGNICPECGRGFNSNAPYVSRIPWARRREIGKGRAYWLTVIEAMFRPETFAAEAMQSSSRAVVDAESFRRTTLWLAAASFGIGLAAILCAVKRERALLILLTMSPLFTALIWGYLMIAEQVVQDLRLFSKDGLRRPMARVMLRYTCAPLALAPLNVVGLCVLIFVDSRLSWGVDLFGIMTMMAVIGVLPLLWWVCAFRLVWWMTGGSVPSAVEVSVLVPLGWGIIGLFWSVLLAAPIAVVMLAF